MEIQLIAWIQNIPYVAPLIRSLDRKIYCKQMVRGLYGIYEQFKEKSFPKLLKDLTIPNEEKRKIEDLLRKPWNLYIISALSSWNILL